MIVPRRLSVYPTLIMILLAIIHEQFHPSFVWVPPKRQTRIYTIGFQIYRPVCYIKLRFDKKIIFQKKSVYGHTRINTYILVLEYRINAEFMGFKLKPEEYMRKGITFL